MNAGLTNMQARVFITVIELGQSSIHRISELSEIDRSNVYKTINALEELELIEKNIGIPTLYKAVPLPIAISILTKRKKLEYTKALKGLERFAKDSDTFRNPPITEKKDYFKIFPAGKEIFCQKWEKTLKEIKHSIDLIVTEKREPKDQPIWDIYVNLLKRGVKVRWIIDRSNKNDDEFAMRVLQFQHLFCYQTIEMRICYDCIKPWGINCDNEFVIIFLDDKPPIKNSRTLWTNNEPILLNFKEHFETNWKKAIPYPVIIEE